MPKSQWFVIHTLSGQEQKVKENIEKRLKAEEMTEYIKEVLVPVEKVVDVRGGKKTVTNRKLHPGYVYIDMVLLDENNRIMERPWYFIQDTPGKIGIVGGDRPIAVTPGRNCDDQGANLRVARRRRSRRCILMWARRSRSMTGRF